MRSMLAQDQELAGVITVPCQNGGRGCRSFSTFDFTV